jgi:hypothetical protein
VVRAQRVTPTFAIGIVRLQPSTCGAEGVRRFNTGYKNFVVVNPFGEGLISPPRFERGTFGSGGKAEAGMLKRRNRLPDKHFGNRIAFCARLHDFTYLQSYRAFSMYSVPNSVPVNRLRLLTGFVRWRQYDGVKFSVPTR